MVFLEGHAELLSHLIFDRGSVEQISFAEFQQYLPTPTSIANIGMRPLDGGNRR